MTTTETIWDADAEDFARELVGRRIVAITEKAIVLDDGTTLIMESTSSCCAYFNVTGVTAAPDIADNIITAVRRDDSVGELSEAFTIVVLSEAKEVASIGIDGTESSGYYCHSINLEVSRPGAAS